MRPNRYHHLVRRYAMSGKEIETISNNSGRRAAPSRMHAADKSAVTGGHQHRQAIGSHHPHLLPAQCGKNRVGMRAFRQRLLKMMNHIAVHQLHRSQFSVRKGGRFVYIEKGIANAGNIAQ